MRRLAADRRSRSPVCGDRAVAASAGFAQGFDGLSGGEKKCGLDVSHGTASGESDGDGRGGDVVWKFSDGQDVEGAESEERGMDLAAKLFDGRAHRFQAVLGILHQARPSFLGVADLMAEVGHEGGSFLEGDNPGYWGEYAPGAMGSQEERLRGRGSRKNIFAPEPRQLSRGSFISGLWKTARARKGKGGDLLAVGRPASPEESTHLKVAFQRRNAGDTAVIEADGSFGRFRGHGDRL